MQGESAAGPHGHRESAEPCPVLAFSPSTLGWALEVAPSRLGSAGVTRVPICQNCSRGGEPGAMRCPPMRARRSWQAPSPSPSFCGQSLYTLVSERVRRRAGAQQGSPESSPTANLCNHFTTSRALMGMAAAGFWSACWAGIFSGKAACGQFRDLPWGGRASLGCTQLTGAPLAPTESTSPSEGAAPQFTHQDPPTSPSQ